MRIGLCIIAGWLVLAGVVTAQDSHQKSVQPTAIDPDPDAPVLLPKLHGNWSRERLDKPRGVVTDQEANPTPLPSKHTPELKGLMHSIFDLLGKMILLILVILSLIKLVSWVSRILSRAYQAISNRPELYVPAYAGLGTGFGVIYSQAVGTYIEADLKEYLVSAATIAIVAIGIIMFIEPLKERFGELCGITTKHSVPNPKFIGATALVLVLTSVMHGMLHSQVEKQGVAATSGILISSAIMAGSITFAWILGSRLNRRRSAWLGGLAGIGLGAFYFFGVWATLGGKIPFAEGLMPVAPDLMTRLAIGNGTTWGCAGFAGGLAIDKRWTSSPVRGASLALAPAIICSLCLQVAIVPEYAPMVKALLPTIILTESLRLLGWAGGLMVVESAANTAFSNGQ